MRSNECGRDGFGGFDAYVQLVFGLARGWTKCERPVEWVGNDRVAWYKYMLRKRHQLVSFQSEKYLA